MDEIPAQRLHEYARRIRKRRPITVGEIAAPRRTLEIAPLLKVLAARQSDTVLKLIEMRIAEVWHAAYAASHPEPQPEVPEEIMLSVARAVNEPAVSDAEFRDQCRTLLAPSRPEVRGRRRSRAHQVRLYLAGNIRGATDPQVLVEIGLQSQGPHEVIQALGELAYCYSQQEYYLHFAAISPAGKAWDELIGAEDWEAAFRAFEAATLWGARRGLRSGSVLMADDPAITVERGDAELLRARLYGCLGRVQITELLLAIDGETHFTWELLGSAPSAAEELLPLHAAIFVAAMGLESTDVAMMIPGVSLSDIRCGLMLLEEERPLRRANDTVVQFMLAQPLSKAWGDGFETSDLMSLES